MSIALEAKLADGTITSRLEAAIACRPARTTLRPPARQPEVRMSMCPVLGTLVPFGIHRTCRIVRRTGCVLSVLASKIQTYGVGSSRLHGFAATEATELGSHGESGECRESCRHYDP